MNNKLKQRLRSCILIEGARVLDLVDDRETHIVSYHPSAKSSARDFVEIWFDPSCHKLTGTGRLRGLSQIVLL